MKSRILVVFLVLIALWGALILRGAFLQVIPNEKLTALKERQFQRKVKMPGRRGAITDRNGHELAISVTSYSLFADPKLIKNPRTLARKLSKEIKIPFKKIYKKIKQPNRRFVWLKRQLPKEQKDKIRSWGYRGLGFIEEAKRVYPNGQLLANVLGFVGRGNRGLEGIERAYQKYLSGVDQEVVLRRDARGRPLIVDLQMFSENRDGLNVELTIDRDLQYHLEKEIKKTVLKNRAESAVAVILDANSSEVLAMANYPTFDPNEPGKTPARWRKNRTVTDAFEPGSTMKTILMGVALKAKAITPNKRYFCENGRFRVGRRTINEADAKHHFGWLTASEILGHSSNIGTTKIAFDLGAEKYHQGLIDFGFGQKTGVDFPGEVRGIVNALPWRKHLLSNVSFGHGVATTPLQMAAAYAAIANGGVWRTPTLVRSLEDRWGEKKEFVQDVKEKRVLSASEAAQLALMMNTVTGTGGTVANARVPGFPVAGKTGTAQKVRSDGRGYVKGKYISSFSGFAPAHSPKYVIYVAVDSPKKVYYGSQVAAPVFSKIASFALRRSGMSPVLITEKNLLSTKTESELRQKKALKRLSRKKNNQSLLHKVPDLEGLTLREVYQRAEKNKIKLNIHGRGIVARTSPPPGFPLDESQELDVYLSLRGSEEL